MGLFSGISKALGLTPEAPNIPSLGARSQLLSFVDELSGVEQVEVKNPDGTRSIVTRKIPLSAEQQAENQRITESITSLLGQVDELTAMGIAAESEAFSPIVEAATELRRQQLNEDVANIAEQQEEALAARGLSASTVGAQQRAMLASEQAQSLSDINKEGILLGEQLRQQQLQNTLAGLQPVLGLQQQRLGLEQSALNRGTGLQLSLAGIENQRDVRNNQIAQQNAMNQFQAQQAGLSNLIGLGSTIATAGAGGFGGFGSLLGSGSMGTFARQNLGTSLSTGLSPRTLTGAF